MYMRFTTARMSFIVGAFLDKWGFFALAKLKVAGNINPNIVAVLIRIHPEQL